MPCTLGWRFMTCFMVLDVVMCIVSSCVWGAGLVGTVIGDLLDSEGCSNDCLTAAQEIVLNIQVFASGLYAATGLAAAIAILGLLSGQLWLQVPNVAVSLIRLVGSLVIGEYLIQVKMGAHLFAYNRSILYFCLVVNFVTFICNFAQANREYRRKLMERIGLIEPEVRPLTMFIDRLLGSTNPGPYTLPDSMEGILPEMLEDVAEDAHRPEVPLSEALIESKPSRPEKKDDALNQSEVDLGYLTVFVHQDGEREGPCLVNMDEEVLVGIANGDEPVRSGRVNTSKFEASDRLKGC